MFLGVNRVHASDLNRVLQPSFDLAYLSLGDILCPFTSSSGSTPYQESKPPFAKSCFKVNQPSRAEPGCLSIHVFESLREPRVFAVTSEWVDEAAFDLHAAMPHTVRFLAAAETLLTHPVQGLRLRHIGGGAGMTTR